MYERYTIEFFGSRKWFFVVDRMRGLNKHNALLKTKELDVAEKVVAFFNSQEKGS